VFFEGEVIVKAESLINSYGIGDPSVTRELEREAVRWQMVSSMALDSRLGTN